MKNRLIHRQSAYNAAAPASNYESTFKATRRHCHASHQTSRHPTARSGYRRHHPDPAFWFGRQSEHPPAWFGARRGLPQQRRGCAGISCSAAPERRATKGPARQDNTQRPEITDAHRASDRRRRGGLCSRRRSGQRARSAASRILHLAHRAGAACGGKLKIIAAIEAPDVIERILTHLGLSAQPPPRAAARREEFF